MSQYILSIDQGTTSSRVIIFNQLGQSIAQHQIEFQQHFPQSGWVEHDPEDIWQTVVECCRQALLQANLTANDISAIGISNQRETTLVWERDTGKPIYPAIVWQDRRTADSCERLQQDSAVVNSVAQKTGLLLDPYFSATKIAWILDNVPQARQRAQQGELLFGTVDTYLIWQLSGGKRHTTDATNASRTLLFNIHDQCWDKELLSLFDIPESLLPEVLDSDAHFADTASHILGASIPITGVAGDQQAATVGQACFQPGMIKSTYGTGCFLLLNTGNEVVRSQHRLLSTIAYRINGQVSYGLEGSIFIAGAAVKWLRDAINLIEDARDTQSLAASIEDTDGVYLVPAFTGLGAPYWDPHARGALLGLTRDSGIAHIVRAALEAVCYQTKDLMRAMQSDYQQQLATLRVDGGMVANDWLLQFLSDILALEVERPACIETSALGAAYLAGLGAGIYKSLDEIAELWKLQKHFSPQMSEQKREQLYKGWQEAIQRVL